MDRGPWWAIVHGVTKSWTRLSDFTFTFTFTFKETKELYTENYKTLVKEIKDDINRWERYSMFLGRKNQYCENDYTTKCNTQIQ